MRQRINYEIKTDCPEDSFGLDITQILWCLEDYIKQGPRGRMKTYDGGSDRSIRIKSFNDTSKTNKRH